MKLSCEYKIEWYNLISIEVVLLTSGITNKVKEQLEEWSLMAVFALFTEDTVKNVHDSLNGVIEENVRVVTGNEFIADDYKLWIIFNIGCIDGAVVRTEWELNLL